MKLDFSFSSDTEMEDFQKEMQNNMSLGVGKEFPNKAPTNINPEKKDIFPSIKIKKNNATYCF